MRLVKLAAIVALLFVHGFALRYILPSAMSYGIYESRRDWLTIHIFAGTLAILLGPVQFWLALNGNYAKWHRALGVAYIMSVGLSSAAAIYLAFHTDFGWVFRTGMMVLAFVWIGTTGLGF